MIFLPSKYLKAVFIYKVKALLIDGSELYIREYVDISERNYSYHWQDLRRQMLMRWDNSLHHRHIETYPHHVHHGDNILPSYHISCKEILKVIEDKISIKKDG